jgi:hypothetical protein
MVVFLEINGISVFDVDIGVDFARNGGRLSRRWVAVDAVRMIIRMWNNSSLHETRTKETTS